MNTNNLRDEENITISKSEDENNETEDITESKDNELRSPDPKKKGNKIFPSFNLKKFVSPPKVQKKKKNFFAKNKILNVAELPTQETQETLESIETEHNEEDIIDGAKAQIF